METAKQNTFLFCEASESFLKISATFPKDFRTKTSCFGQVFLRITDGKVLDFRSDCERPQHLDGYCGLERV
jgi:hypothetical protein